MTTDRSQKIIIAVLAALLVVVSAALVLKVSLPPSAPLPQGNTNAIVNEYSNPNPDNTPEPVANGHDLVPNDAILKEYAGLTVRWETTAAETTFENLSSLSAELNNKIPVGALAEIRRSLGTPGELDYFGAIKYRRVGLITASTTGKFIGDNLYRIEEDCGLGSDCIYALAIADKAGGTFITLKRYSTYPTSGTALDKYIKVDETMAIPDLEAPPTLALSWPGYLLTTNRKGMGLVGSKPSEPDFLTSDGTKIYTDIEFPKPSGMFWARLASGEYLMYYLTIPFYANERIPTITWNDGTMNTADYSPKTRYGCGGGERLGVIEDKKSYSNRLVPGGKTSNGETVYLLNGTDQTLVDLYTQFGAYSDIGMKPSYEEFVASRPIFFWYDPMGDLVKWDRADVVPMAECGKPVVYLYPTQTEQVSVKLGNNIEVTKSEPAYSNGWKVTAQPNGTLTTADGKTFPYLYWDGNGASYSTPTTGFIVASKDVEATLAEKLTRLGLNEKEIVDFNEFWVPIVAKSPYARISFVPQDEWSKAAPLAISPAPETVIRVFMDWKPLSAPISIDPQILPPTPERTGFTAVEWGGLLYK